MAASKRIRQILAAAIIIASVAIAGTIALKQFRSASPQPTSRTTSPEIDMAMTRVAFSEMRGDEKLWDLTAEKAEYDKEPGMVRLDVVRTEIHEGKAGGAVITSQKGVYNEASRIVMMSGKVHVVTKRGMVLDTEYLEYRPAENLLVTDRPVKVVDGRLHLTALGMTLNTKEERVRFHQQVNSVIEGRNAKR